MLSLLECLRVLGENELEKTRQEKTGTICLAGVGALYCCHRDFGTATCLCLTGWIPSFSFRPTYEDFSRQVNLSSPAYTDFKTKGMKPEAQTDEFYLLLKFPVAKLYLTE